MLARVGEASNFWDTFSSRASCYGGEQSDPRKGCSVAQGAAESRSCLGLSERRPYDLSRLCAGLRLQLPVYPHLLLRRSPIATGLEVMIGGEGRGK